MIEARCNGEAGRERRLVLSGTGEEHWRTELFDRVPAAGGTPQAFLIEMTPHETILPHFHEVDQFQVFVAGTGTLGRRHDQLAGVLVHYTDRYTGYGPIKAGARGLSYFALRPRTDSGAVYLHKPGYREKLGVSKKRHRVAQVIPSTEPVLMHRTGVVEEVCFEDSGPEADGLAAYLLRMGPGNRARGRDPKSGGGQYYLVLQGSLELAGSNYSARSIIFLGPDEEPLALQSGSAGLEILILQCPRDPGK